MQDLYSFFIKFHIVFSALFLIVSVAITVHALVGLIKNKPYGLFDNRFRITFLTLLYVDLVLGIILYFFLQKPAELITPEEAMRYSSLRFWAIQHFSNMIFVVILSVIGNIFINKTSKAIKKHKYSLIYFGISSLIIIVSVGLFALRK